MNALTGLLLAVIFQAPTESRDQWSRFRGENGEGIGCAVTLPARPTLENAVLWKTSLEGDGNGSPVAWDRTIYLQTADKKGGSRKLVAIDALTGMIVWQAELKGGGAKTHAKNSLASSTPACDAKGIYSVFWDGAALFATGHDHQGKLLWNHPLGAFKSQHGAGHSPVVFEGRVFINFDQDDKAELVCLDAATGKVVWSKERPAYRSSYSTPIFRSLPDGSRELLVASTAGAAGYDPATGKVLWETRTRHAKNPLRVVSSPLIAGDLLVFGGGDGSGDRQTTAIRLGQSDGEPVWEDLKSFPYVPTGLALGERLFEVSDKGFFGVYQARTGKSLSQVRLPGAFSASLVLAGSKIVAVSEAGEVHLLDPREGPQKSISLALGEPVFATPALYKNRLYIKSRNTLFCLGTAATEAPQPEDR